MGAGRDPETPTGHGVRTLGDGDDGPGTRRMFDKRTLRKMYRGPFQAAIGEFAQQGAANKAKAPVLPPGGTAVYVRKRPLFPRELETDEFDIITPVDAVTVLHDCKLRADLKTPYILHRTFPLRCFPETLSNDEVCDAINLPKLIQRAIDGEHVTCCMFGQTGSGKSHTMAGILAQAARILFASSELERPPHFHAQLSCFEVCGSNCFDLLQGGDKLIVRENAALKVEVSARQVDVKSSDAFSAQLKAATANRATSSTLRNMDSSRSHAFYRLTLYASTPGPVPATAAVPPTPGTPTAGGRGGGLTSPGSARPPVPGRTGSTVRSAARPSAVSVTGASSRAPPSPTPGSRRPGTSSAGAATPPSAARGTAAKTQRPSISIPRNNSGDGVAGGAARRVASPGAAAGRTSPGSRTLASTTSTGARGRTAASPTPASRRTPSMSSNADSPSARKAATSASRPPFDNRPLRPQEKASPSSSRLSAAGATSPGVARRLHMTPEQRRAAAASGRSTPGSARASTRAATTAPGPRPAGPTEEEDDEVPAPIGQEDGPGVTAASPVPSPRPEQPSAEAEAADRQVGEGAEEAAAAASPSQAASPGPTESPAVASPASAGAVSPAADVPAAAGHSRSLSSGSVLGGGMHSRNASSASVFSEGKSHRRTPSGTVLMMSHSRSPSLTQLPSIDVAAAAAPVPPPPRVERGTITFVDLAGSERAWDSMYHDAEQRKQTAEINASLSCLKECFRIRSLQMQAAAARGNASPAALRVPYRDSRLTLLLRDSLQSTNSKEPCVVVVATLSPCAGDTEHTLNTLRNAITMTGLDVSHANKGETSREQEIAVDDGGSKVVRHPSRWTTEELKEWMSTVSDGKYAVAADNLTSTTDGKAIMRFAPVRFKQLCNGNARMGDDLYKLFKSEVKRANESKSQHQESVRNISNVKVFA